ncbi:MAG: SpoIIE family protein phosphatase [Candidatus Xenobia bacterium]
MPGDPCGDSFWYSEEGDWIWLAVLDGLGSGPDAAEAARLGTSVLRDMVAEAPATWAPASRLEQFVYRCDRALRQTRGCALGLALLQRGGGAWFSGVGNVELRCLGTSSTHPAGVAGIVGAGLRKVRIETFPYRPGDVVLLHSDGLSSRFTIPEEHRHWTLDALGERLVHEHRKPGDDMTLLMVRDA